MNMNAEIEASEAQNLIECTALGDKSDGGRSMTTEFDQCTTPPTYLDTGASL